MLNIGNCMDIMIDWKQLQVKRPGNQFMTGYHTYPPPPKKKQNTPTTTNKQTKTSFFMLNIGNCMDTMIDWKQLQVKRPQVTTLTKKKKPKQTKTSFFMLL